MDKELQAQLEAAEQKATELQTANEALVAEVAQLRERIALGEAKGVVAAKLAASELPQITKDRLSESLVSLAKLTEDGALDSEALEASVTEAIATEATYVAQLTESGKVRDQGEGTTPDGKAALQESFKRRYVAEGMSDEQAEKMAALAAAGR